MRIGDHANFKFVIMDQVDFCVFIGDHATEMFTRLLEDTVAFGGRAALLPLLYHTCRAIFRKIPPSKHGSIQSADCTACKGPKAVFFRSASIILQSQKIRI